ncbi:folate family ECF transporter S component [Anaerosinus massiliensis]|uniref:folate family ECF transporter S component n=1 Tax=Massilibacillus massiliensis TaxID=1806837 RepID=UPI000DA5F1C3|nr:folate family ECF transporter S component [Massilibacillus massiliensis]
MSLRIKTIVFSAIFISLTIIFTHILAIQTPFVRVSFAFLPIALFSAMFGPTKGGFMAAIADLLGCFIFFPGLYFPGFTFSAFMTGMLYGYFFHQKKITLKKVILVHLLLFLTIDLFLNTIWLCILYKKAAYAFFMSRFIKGSILLPIQISTFYTLYKALQPYKFSQQMHLK